MAKELDAKSLAEIERLKKAGWATSKGIKKKSTDEPVVIQISNEICKGCEICVEVCTHDALMMVEYDKKYQGQIAKVKDVNNCIKCMLCELHCPDFCIKIY